MRDKQRWRQLQSRVSSCVLRSSVIISQIRLIISVNSESSLLLLLRCFHLTTCRDRRACAEGKFHRTHGRKACPFCTSIPRKSGSGEKCYSYRLYMSMFPSTHMHIDRETAWWHFAWLSLIWPRSSKSDLRRIGLRSCFVFAVKYALRAMTYSKMRMYIVQYL